MRGKQVSIRRWPAIVLTLAVVAAACGGDDTDASDATTTSQPTTSTTTTTTTEAPPSTTEAATSTTVAPTSTTAAPTTTTTTTVSSGGEPVPDADLPGEAFDLTPEPDAALAVVGVRFDDTLNVRRIPGMTGEIVAELGPTSNDARATGRARLLPQSIWWEVVTADGVIGWVSARFTARLGPTFDTTAAVVDALGEWPEAATIDALGLLVAEAVPRDPDVPSSIVMSVAPNDAGDVRDVTFDVVGIGDDAVHAIRVHVFGDPLPDAAGVSLRSVEQTDMCDSVRGPSEPDGICA